MDRTQWTQPQLVPLTRILRSLLDATGDFTDQGFPDGFQQTPTAS